MPPKKRDKKRKSEELSILDDYEDEEVLQMNGP